MLVKGRVALVTGGAVRVGRAIALALARQGADVAITYRSSAESAKDTVALIQQYGVRAMAVRCDQRFPEQISSTLREVEAGLGTVQILVNSAAIFERTPVDAASLEDWDSHLEVNLRGPWLFVQSVVPGMQRLGDGAIVNLVDIAAERPFPSYLPYSVSKAGLVALTKGLAVALAPGIRVNGIAPGAVMWPEDYTDEQKAVLIKKTPMSCAGNPEDVAAAVIFLIEGSDFITGTIMPVDGGRSAAP